MCYSAMIRAEHKRYMELFQVRVSIQDYVKFFWERRHDFNLNAPKALEANFADPQTDDEREIKQAIDERMEAQALVAEQDLFKQKTRLVDAERKLEKKVTKAASESKRIATDKIEWRLGQLADLKSTELRPIDFRFFPKWHTSVMVLEDGKKVLKPMRFLYRPPGAPEVFDVQYKGAYNARRDSLENFYWRHGFTRKHGVVIATRFFEHVNRHRLEGRELRPGEEVEDVVIEFNPQDGKEMLLACVWSHWRAEGKPDLLTFALVTDEPPPEVAAAGHDRCPIPLKRENVDAWLSVAPGDTAAAYALLDDRERPYYEHRLALAA
jgi:putative SOS response-associated peptidase YedK